ncbi:MAG TPA: rhomboid family intramembrane serine protease [Candidatus Angelobacter sp.]|nr:rhomboid family intramembrane serine protease [Candidatus Angelobacter sp.]
MPNCLKCGTSLAVNEEGVAPVLCDRCAGVATGRARRAMSLGGLGRSPVTLALIAINVVAFILQQVPGLNVTFWGENIGPLTLSGEYWRLFTAGFLHANILHIGFNMWCLYSLGMLSERLFGKWQTFAIYMITGVGGALLSIAHSPNHGELGASGAIFGIVGAVIAGVKFGEFNISAGEKRAVVSSAVSFTVLNFALGFSGIGMFGSVDNFCHLGGLVSGLLIGLPLGAFHRKHLLQLATVVVTSAVLVVAGRELVQTRGPEAQRNLSRIAAQQGDFVWEAELLEKYIRSNPGDEQALLDLGTAYATIGQTEKAVDSFEHVLALNPNSEEAKQALQELRGSSDLQKK